MSKNEYTPPESSEELVLKWIKRARESQFSHHYCLRFFKILHYLIGIPATLLTVVVGTSAFKALESAQDSNSHYMIVSLAIIAAILSALQTFLNPQEKYAAHKNAADTFSEIRRDLEEAYATKQITNTVIASAKKKYNDATKNAPDVSSRVFKNVSSILSND